MADAATPGRRRASDGHVGDGSRQVSLAAAGRGSGAGVASTRLAVVRRRAEIAQFRADIGKLVQEEINYRADLAIARRHLGVVQGELRRNQRLGKQNVISAGKIDISRQAVLRQEREVQRIRNLLALAAPNLDQKKAALDVTRVRLEEANLNLIRTRIVAPFDARVRNTNLAVGNYIREGNTVGTIYDPAVLEVPVSIPVEEARWAFRRTGAARFPKTQDEVQQYFPRAKIYWSRFGQRFEWAGRVTLVGAGLDEATRAFTLVIEVPEPTKKWTPGYARFDAAATWRVNKTMDVQLNVQNLFDKKYYASAYPIYATWAPGRSAMVTLNFYQ